MSKGYVVAEPFVTKPCPAWEEYRTKVQATGEAYGGRFLARGGDPALLEGDHPAGRLVILEFPSTQHANDWYNAAAYQEIPPAPGQCIGPAPLPNRGLESVRLG